MGQVLHGSATTTEAVRRAIQHSQESLRVLARRYGINPKTVAKWRKRGSVPICRPAPRTRSRPCCRSRRRQSLSPSVDIRCCRSTIASLRAAADNPASHAASSLHRCHRSATASPACRRLTATSLTSAGSSPTRSASFHIDIAEVRTEEGKLYLFVAIDWTSKFAFVELHERASARAAASLLEALTGAVPYKLHAVLTDNGTQFTDLPKTARKPPRCGAVIRSTAPADSTASSIGSPRPTIHGPRGRSNE